jgi:hypothetical protein
MIFIVIRYDEALERGDSASEERGSRLPAGRCVVTAVNHDALAAAGRNERASAVFDIKNLK